MEAKQHFIVCQESLFNVALIAFLQLKFKTITKKGKKGSDDQGHQPLDHA